MPDAPADIEHGTSHFVQIAIHTIICTSAVDGTGICEASPLALCELWDRQCCGAWCRRQRRRQCRPCACGSAGALLAGLGAGWVVSVPQAAASARHGARPSAAAADGGPPCGGPRRRCSRAASPAGLHLLLRRPGCCAAGQRAEGAAPPHASHSINQQAVASAPGRSSSWGAVTACNRQRQFRSEC